jgi:hypothetical protein
VLADDGLAAIEVPHLLPLHARLEYDTIYHEHLCYFSLRALEALLVRVNLELVDVRELALHGGSILLTAQRRGGPRGRSVAVDRLVAREEEAGLHRLEPRVAFANRVARSRTALCAALDDLHARGRTLAGYGAPAKGMTLLAYCGIGPEQLPYLVDKSPHKQGLVTPGHHIPVHAPERLLQDRPDVLLVLAWNFAAEIARQQQAYLQGGGQFLLPVPLAHYLPTTRASTALAA